MGHESMGSDLWGRALWGMNPRAEVCGAQICGAGLYGALTPISPQAQPCVPPCLAALRPRGAAPHHGAQHRVPGGIRGAQICGAQLYGGADLWGRSSMGRDPLPPLRPTAAVDAGDAGQHRGAALPRLRAGFHAAPLRDEPPLVGAGGAALRRHRTERRGGRSVRPPPKINLPAPSGDGDVCNGSGGHWGQWGGRNGAGGSSGG